MENKNRVREIIKILRKEYTNAKLALNFSNPLELLVATILSAQCTDERVNKVTKNLFKKYKTPKDYANVKLEEFEKEIHSTGFYKSKAKNIKEMAKILVEKFNSEVPKSMKELISLPGVARKTANIVLSNAFDIVEGIAVDTHVKRLSQRLKLSEEKNPEKIEQDLMKIVPKKFWKEITLLLMLHGRKICNAKKPLCNECKLNKICPSAFNFD
ncbi:MAG: endonuclease III [Deltaproteobacteria bacterium]|nr:MAG: endonuclease III [Deltaproteobacteria bacterium]